MTTENPLHPYNFFFELPLYSEIPISGDADEKSFRYLISTNYKIDAYHPELKENTTYSVGEETRMIRGSEDLSSYSGFSRFTLTCVRTNFKITCFTFLSSYEDEEGNDHYSLQKVG